jgi:phytoene synthase
MTRTRAEEASSAAVVREAARAGELDRYLAALLAPRRARPDLVALTAFLGEIARIPDQVSEPMMGEMRLQWWRDMIETADAGTSTGSPVADALVGVMARHALPRELFTTLLEARSRELLPEHLAGGQDLNAYLDDTDGAAFRLTARVLGAGEAGGADELLAAAGQAYGRIRLLRGLPAARARGRGLPGGERLPDRPDDRPDGAWPLLDGAKAWLAEARRLIPAAPRGVVPAILPLALVEPYLAALERLGPDIARERADISPLTRVWRLWRASARGRV